MTARDGWLAGNIEGGKGCLCWWKGGSELGTEPGGGIDILRKEGQTAGGTEGERGAEGGRQGIRGINDSMAGWVENTICEDDLCRVIT